MFVKETFLQHKTHNDPHILIVGDFNIQLEPMYSSSMQKINGEILVLTDINQMDIIDVYRTFHPNTKEYTTLFSVAHGTSSKIDHILGYEASLNRYKKTEVTSSLLLDHHRLKLDVNKRNVLSAYIKTNK